VIAVEAALRSGSLITMSIAAKQGSLVCLVSGSALSPIPAGCHLLLRDGATLVSTYEHIIQDVFPTLSLDSNVECAINIRLDSITEDQLRLLKLLDYNSTSMESLICRSGLTADKVSSILIGMELEQLVAQKFDGTYTRLR